MACLNPKVITNKYGETMKVSCGHCKACYNIKTKNYCDQAVQESAKYPYVVFFTLTYKSEYLPQVKAYASAYNDDGSVAEVVYVLRNDRKSDKRIARYYDDFVIDGSTDKHTILASLDDRIYSDKFKSEYIPFLFKKDLQNFLKRLRSKLKYDYEENQKLWHRFRYFCCGEYGPIHYRPHYHGSIYCSTLEQAHAIISAIPETWKFGRTDQQLSAGSESQRYVAGYVNSYLGCPSFLKFRWNKPFSIHSAHYGASPDEEYYQDIESLTYRNIVSREYEVKGDIKQYLPSLSLQNSLFPRCYRYSVSDDLLNVVRYRLYEIFTFEFPRHGKDFCVTELASLALTNDMGKPIYGNYTLDEILFDSDDKFSTLVTMLYMSRKVLRLCDKYSCSPWYYYHHVIKKYYADKDLMRLSEFYDKQAVDAEEYGYKYLINDYTNALSMVRKVKSFNVPRETLLNVLQWPTNDPRVCRNIEVQSKIFSDKIKHKKLNDLNKRLGYE